jgi:2-polyprenyl-6-hydroxyphenyl methylase/3-demethylubiquinone-9 3-methyltransferase
MMMKNYDETEISKFAGMAETWWDRKGILGVLHDINPIRLNYIDSGAGLEGKQVLDIGCGGGILSEAMAARGALVTGIDMAPSSLEAARAHMNGSGFQITYLQTSAEALAEEMPGRFDVTTCMELVEHVPDPRSIVEACSRLVKPGGHVFFATVNRTWTAYLFVIVLAEYVFGIVKRGTHQYHRFIKPSELERWGRLAGISLQNLTGMRYIPFIRFCSTVRDTRMNYLMHFRKAAS